MLEITFRISEDVIFKLPGEHVPITLGGFYLWWDFAPTPLSQTWIRSRKWSCYFGDLNGKEKAAIRWLFEIEIGGEGDQKFCELISGIREVLGIVEQVQIVK